MVQEGRRMQSKPVEIVAQKLCAGIQESKAVVTFGGRPERIELFTPLVASCPTPFLQTPCPPSQLAFPVNNFTERNHLSNFKQETQVFAGATILVVGFFLWETITEMKHLFLLLFTRGSLSAVMISRVPSASKTTLQIAVEISSLLFFFFFAYINKYPK